MPTARTNSRSFLIGAPDIVTHSEIYHGTTISRIIVSCRKYRRLSTRYCGIISFTPNSCNHFETNESNQDD